MPTALTALWTANLLGPARALSFAGEAELLAVRDANSALSLFNSFGSVQGQVKIRDLAAADLAADGSAILIATSTGRVAWLGIDLKQRWETQLGGRLITAAIDPFGQYAVVTDDKGALHFLDRHMKSLGRFQSPRPIHHARFVAAAPFLACAGDFGWAGLLDLLRGEWAWSDRPVANIGGLAVGSTGEPLLLACFSEGVRVYGTGGGPRTTIALAAPCESVAASFDGFRFAASTKAREVFLGNYKGPPPERVATPHTPSALALSPQADRLFCGYGNATVQCLEVAGG